MDEKEYFHYTLALGSIILAIAGLVSDKNRILALLMGFGGISVTIMILLWRKHTRERNALRRDINRLTEAITALTDVIKRIKNKD